MTTPPGHVQPHPFDIRPLIEPVDRGAVRRFDREMRRRFGISAVTEVVLWVIFDLFILALFGWIYVDVTRDSPQAAPGTAIILAPLALGLIAVPTPAQASTARLTRGGMWR